MNRRRRRENGRSLLSTQKFIGGKSTKIHRPLHKPYACRLLSSIVELDLVTSMRKERRWWAIHRSSADQRGFWETKVSLWHRIAESYDIPGEADGYLDKH